MRSRKIAAIVLFLITFQTIAMSQGTSSYCGEPLVGSTDAPRIGDSSITASSMNLIMTSIGEARLGAGENNGWIPNKRDKHPYLQFDLEKLYLICGFEVQGCGQSWVTRYRVQVSPEENFWDPWNYIKPEFYGGKSDKDRVYSVSKERKVGRYVRIFPYDAKRQGGFLCMQVEVYGVPYLSNGQEVFVLQNPRVMSYKKWKLQRLEAVDVVVITDSKLSRKELYGAINYTQVIPYAKPLKTELNVDSCVIAPSLRPGNNGDYLSGRVDKVNAETDDYVIEYLTDTRDVKKKNHFKRKELQVVFSAWCRKINHFDRVFDRRHRKYRLCHGQIVQVDTMLVFQAKALAGLARLSFHDRKQTDYVSSEKVEPSNLKRGKTKLLYEDLYQCLESGTFMNYYSGNGLFILGRSTRKRAHELRYKDSSGRDLCNDGEEKCWNSRIPFTVTRLKCLPSKIWNGKHCEDENECKTGMAACGLNAACKNTPGYYKCFCPRGTVGNNPRTKPCNDVDECAKNVCHKDAICKNTVGSFTCHCKKGFKGDGHKSCVDIDECKVPANKQNCEVHKNAFCKNFPGGFQCACKPGYHGHFKQCKDLDECASKRHKCSLHADCSNAIGFYTCKCRKGFSGDGRNCEDIQECKYPSISRKCHPSLGQCVDFPGGYKCECKEGYVGDGIKSCALANECELGIHSCHKEATCINTRKSYDCRCNKGFEGDGRSCKDIDECAKKDDYCGLIRDGIECVNTDGSHKCICAKGFTGDGKTCVNIDECETGAHNCVKDAICIDTKGSFSCRCRDEFYGDPTKECKPETKCMKALPDCDVPRAVCANRTHSEKVSYICYCKPGFTGRSSQCIDVDECADKDSNKCSTDAICTNTAGGYECRCKDGFIGNGFSCQDVNECSNETRCPENAICVNTKGSFKCQCKSGFYGEDPYKQCLDVNECLLGKCGYVGQTCTNTFGSFECRCITPGFKNINPSKARSINITCEDIDECSTQETPCGTHYSLACENTVGDYICRCEHGFQFRKKKLKCEDINECDADEYPCVDEATCVNNDGGFECVCPEGYHGNGKYYCGTNSSPSSGIAKLWNFLVSIVTTTLISSLRQV